MSSKRSSTCGNLGSSGGLVRAAPAHGAGPWGEINATYKCYANTVGFHVDACLPFCPEHKGKVENKVRFVRRRLRLTGVFSGLPELQKHTDEQLSACDEKRLCPATGLSVQQTFLSEQRL